VISDRSHRPGAACCRRNIEANRVKPMSALTGDGGAHWSRWSAEEAASLFFLNDSLAGWSLPGASGKLRIRTQLAQAESAAAWSKSISWIRVMAAVGF
jgi:hypothetical protein